jgi:transcriptional regulator with XRE-family HTH domain
VAKAAKSPLKDLRAYRESLGENQSQFWGRFGVTQSGGSRYESGRPPPRPVVILVLAFYEKIIEEEALWKLRKRID